MMMLEAIPTAWSDSGQQKLLIATALFVIVASLQLRMISRAIFAFFSRLYLNWVIVPRKSSAETASVSGLFIHPGKKAHDQYVFDRQA